MSSSKYYYSDSYIKLVMPITVFNKKNRVKSWVNLKSFFLKSALTIGKIDASARYQSIDFVASSGVTVLMLKNKTLNKIMDDK